MGSLAITITSGVIVDGKCVLSLNGRITNDLSMSPVCFPSGATPQKSLDGSPKASTDVGRWLEALQLEKYESLFIENGFDELDFLNGVLSADELTNLGIDEEHVKTIMDAAETLPARAAEIVKAGCKGPVESWLDSIRLNIYRDVFRRHLYLDMDRVSRIWEVELNAVLEITKVGHRRRILATVKRPESQKGNNEPALEEITADLNILVSSESKLIFNKLLNLSIMGTFYLCQMK